MTATASSPTSSCRRKTKALRTDGVDVNADWRGEATSWGRPSVSLSGTWIPPLRPTVRPAGTLPQQPGVFLNDQVVQRWRHRLSFGLDRGPLSLTLSNQYSSGYTDQNSTYDPVSDSLLPRARWPPTALWDLTGSWKFSRDLKLRAGVLNLAGHRPALLQPGLLLPGHLRPHLHRSAWALVPIQPWRLR